MRYKVYHEAIESSAYLPEDVELWFHQATHDSRTGALACVVELLKQNLHAKTVCEDITEYWHAGCVSDKGQPIRVGSWIRSVESTWTGQVVRIGKDHNEPFGPMMECQAIYWPTMELEPDDTCFYAPADTIVLPRKPLPNPL